MAERKSVNKYIPPNFDPDAIPERAPYAIQLLPNSTAASEQRRPQRTVRLMLPFSLRCNTCGEYVYKGRKFNARKETVWGEDYLGVQIFRFYVRCTQCAAEITFKTDPRNADYVCEHGATRNCEPWRKEQMETEAARIKRQMEEANDPMKALENRTIDSKREIDLAEALDELRAIKRRMELVDRDALARQLETEAAYERRQSVRGEGARLSAAESAEIEDAVAAAFTSKRAVEEASKPNDAGLPGIEGTKRSRFADKAAALGIRPRPKS